MCLGETTLLHLLEKSSAHLSWRSGDPHSRRLERINLLLCASLSARNDGTGVAHSTTRWSRQTGDEGHNWLSTRTRVVLLQVLSRKLFRVTANLTNENNA